jgi:hypothetical protein
MDMMAGKKTTLGKVKLLEILASIPYREWEIRQYTRMTWGYRRKELVDQARQIATWGREAQDNEYRHLLAVNEKMKADGIRDPWYLFPPILFFITTFYVVFEKILSLINIRYAFLFNAEFEDHAEHSYSQYVEDNPIWATQEPKSEIIREFGDMKNWAEVFMRISLDERDHRNTSFAFYGKPELIERYEGMKDILEG